MFIYDCRWKYLVYSHLILEDESPTTKFPDMPGYLVRNTTKTDMYLLFGSPTQYSLSIRLLDYTLSSYY